MYTSMIPPYLHSVMPQLDLNEDQNPDQLSSPTGNHTSSSSFSSLSSYPILLDPSDHVQQYEIKHLPNDQEEVEKIITPSSGSWDYSTAENHDSSSSKHRLKIRWKKEQSDNIEAADQDGSVKWMSSKMRMMKKMMVSDQTTDSHIPNNSKLKFEDQKQPLSPLGTDNSSSSNNNNSNNSTIRVCSDCHTTKTPLWRSGPKGPKTLCNACGIRQRKARRALALAAASANGTAIVVASDQKISVKRKKMQKKENKSKIECSTNMKKKCKLDQEKTSQSRNEFSFEDLILTLSLNKNLALQQVFPQDEKEAAILLMALSYGLVHG